jgi:hypothetical protein
MPPCCDPGAKFGHPMPTALLIAAAFAVCVVLPSSASAKQHRSASVKREFQLTHPCPATGRTSGAGPGHVKDHVVPLACGGSDAVSNLQWQTIRNAKAKDKGRRRAVVGRRERPVPLTISTLQNRTGNRPAPRANQEPRSVHRIVHLGKVRARPGARAPTPVDQPQPRRCVIELKRETRLSVPRAVARMRDPPISPLWQSNSN